MKGYPFEVLLPPGLKVQGVILADQLKSLDWQVRRASFGCRVSAEILDEVVGKILALVDPEETR